MRFFQFLLDFFELLCIIINTAYRGVEQLVARRAHNPEVAGSNPASATKEKPLTYKRFKLLSQRLSFSPIGRLLQSFASESLK